MSGISSDVFAEPMLEDDDFLDVYVQELKDLLDQGSVPDLKEEMTYKVYSLQGSKFGSHKSIVLTADDQRFFTIELGFIKIDGVKRIYPVTQNLSPDIKGKLVYHGQRKTTCGDLISKGVATMKNFGKYFKYCNNCQNYCNYYLDAIGLGQQKSLTDGDKLTLAGVASLVLALILKLLHGALKS